MGGRLSRWKLRKIMTTVTVRNRMNITNGELRTSVTVRKRMKVTRVMAMECRRMNLVTLVKMMTIVASRKMMTISSMK